jgi:4-amino-4-deoxy-L-arabinose transferase-like glycosyltransferase
MTNGWSRNWVTAGVYVILLLYVLLIGAYLRLVGIEWRYQYLHPEALPGMGWLGYSAGRKLSGYFDAVNSTLNPENRGHAFYVPHHAALPGGWIWAFRLSGDDQRRASTLRWPTGWWSSCHLVAQRVYDRRVALLAAAFSAFTVLQIQQAHFFTMDTFINLFTLLAIYYAVKIGFGKEAEAPAPASESSRAAAAEPTLPPNSPDPELAAMTAADAPALQRPAGSFLRSPDFWLSIGFGIALGCAVASKLNAVPVAAMLPLAFALRFTKVAPSERSLWLSAPLAT